MRASALLLVAQVPGGQRAPLVHPARVLLGAPLGGLTGSLVQVALPQLPTLLGRPRARLPQPPPSSLREPRLALMRPESSACHGLLRSQQWLLGPASRTPCCTGRGGCSLPARAAHVRRQARHWREGGGSLRPASAPPPWKPVLVPLPRRACPPCLVPQEARRDLQPKAAPRLSLPPRHRPAATPTP